MSVSCLAFFLFIYVYLMISISKISRTLKACQIAFQNSSDRGSIGLATPGLSDWQVTGEKGT